MPLLTAQKHQWTYQPPYNFYHFPEEHRIGWQTFWEEMGGDIDKILDFARAAKIDSPEEWFESLHIFLFSTFSGNPKLLKTAAKKDFGGFLQTVIKNHQDNPKQKQWYTVRGVTRDGFIAVLERAADIKDLRQAVAFINARVKDLGFHLYSEFILAQTSARSKIKSVASDLNKQAYEIECEVLGKSPLEGIAENVVVAHALFPEDRFVITDVIRNDDSSLLLLVAKDLNGKVAFIPDLWNVTQLTYTAQQSYSDPDVSALMDIEDYDAFINALEMQTQQNPGLVGQRETIIQQWQQRHPGTHTVTI